MSDIKEFLFGAATSAYQVEGNNTNSDWWKYESVMNQSLKSGRSANSYELYKEDRKALQKLGVNSYRFSIEWSRVEPLKGLFDKTSIEHYKEVIRDLKLHNITPIVTLHHFTNPLWVEESGGWLNPETVKCFLRYVNFITTELDGLVDYWVTINEPNVYVMSKYVMGYWFPRIRSVSKAFKVAKNFFKAHKSAYEIIKGKNENAQIGFSMNSVKFIPVMNLYALINIPTCIFINYLNNHLIYRLLRNYEDYIGINFYTRIRFSFDFYAPNDYKLISELVNVHNLVFIQYPEDLLWSLKKVWSLKKPILITENGIPTEDDLLRIKYLKSVFKVMKKAKKMGIRLAGYVHWSLIDNFEWNFGYIPKFGLFSIEDQTFRRVAKPSSEVYAQLIKDWK